MLPILPRELLWTDLKTMEEFIELDPLNRQLFQTYNYVRKRTMLMPKPVTAFNDAYYLITKIRFESSRTPHGYQIDTGEVKFAWKLLAQTMAYYILLLCDREKLGISDEIMSSIDPHTHFTNNFETFYFGVEFTELFKGERIAYAFNPRPVPVGTLATLDIDWGRQTDYFDHDCINTIVNLWEDREDRKAVARMIEQYEKETDEGEMHIAALQARLEAKNREIEALQAELKAAIARQQKKTEEEAEPFCYINSELGDEEAAKVNETVKRMVKRLDIPDICHELHKMNDDGRLSLPHHKPKKVYKELVRLGMPSGDGFQLPTFQAQYKD